MNATLAQRQAFLIAILGKNEMYHGSYNHEKLLLALDPNVSEEYLISSLDSENQLRYRALMERRK